MSLEWLLSALVTLAMALGMTLCSAIIGSRHCKRVGADNAHEVGYETVLDDGLPSGDNSQGQ